MIYRTFAQIDLRIRRPLDLIDEPIVSQAEMIDYVNDAIDKAEALIHTLYEDYFLTWDYMALVTGTTEYDLPADIYGMKIRGLVYRNGSTRYPVLKIKGKDMFAKIVDQEQDVSAAYMYFIKNATAAAGVKQVLLPASRETSSLVLQRFYLRNANRIVLTTDLCDIPEFSTFIEAHAKHLAAIKSGHPDVDALKEERDRQEQLMIDTLAAMTPDEDNLIVPDASAYEEHN